MFYTNLKEICSKKKTTPSAVCVALGISKSNAVRWKDGAYPRLDVVLKIAQHLGVNPIRLIPKDLNEVKDWLLGNQMATTWQPNGNQMATQYSKD